MNVLAAGVLLLLFAFVCQLTLWRLSLPRRHTVGLLTVFCVAPLLAVAGAQIARVRPHFSVAETVQIALFYLAFSLAYIVCYSAIEHESPTLAIVTHVANAGSIGCPDREMRDRFGRGTTIADRFAVMERGGWVVRDADRVRLSAQGEFYGRLFELAARVFGIVKGG